jgi:hypothetical protein
MAKTPKISRNLRKLAKRQKMAKSQNIVKRRQNFAKIAENRQKSPKIGTIGRKY